MRTLVPSAGRSLSAAVLDLLYPSVCHVCGNRRDKGDKEKFFCEGCLDSLRGLAYVTESTHSRVVPLSSATLEVHPMAKFAQPLSEIIHLFKYCYNPYLVERTTLILMHCSKSVIKGDFFIPVPLHGVRLRERGYNQSLLVAGQLSSVSGIKIETDVLSRKKRTKSQTGLSREERYRNLAGAFGVAGNNKSRDRIDGARIILVDDVCTTGATLAACAETLLAAGALEVKAVVLAERDRTLSTSINVSQGL